MSFRFRSRFGAGSASGETPFVPEVGLEPLPGYKLIRKRGTGAFATVWESTSPSGKPVALKFMSSQNTSSTARELRSLQAIHRLSHPSLLRTSQVWSVSGNIVIAMDLAEASLLDLFLLYAEEFQQAVDVKKVCLYLYQAAEALDFMNGHKHTFDGRLVGYQHGDIKPNNILIVGEVAKLADYGLAVPMNGPTTPCPRQGTLEYAAPEVFNGMLTDTSDQFSLAVTYYLLRTGMFPFPAPPKTPPRGYMRPNPDLSLATPEEQPILCRALSPVPTSRFPTCLEFMNLLLKANRYEAIRHPERGLMMQPALTPASSTINRKQLSTSGITACSSPSSPPR